MSATPEAKRTAIQVVLNPQQFHDQPEPLQNAWLYLKALRNQETRLENLGPPRHDVRNKATLTMPSLHETQK